ncbi:adenylate/guanylate cyclase domain-containing protein [Microvirga splendida]|uniref:Adenylate/guanylate cyclase domain-containing protein n=1 Tax=Microvirga splendida TaxID=2795727 RepID=A0ABS0XVG2_9HYPH|nr:adenylate/guanylate cyclase domain-containing protein [Microvirga splendida]MBJ6124033.1 adenylate/guanylate cyclase domain-containing protein [Microvirga splendida]
MKVQRRLAAILAADVVGFSRLMSQSEEETLARIKSLRAEVVEPHVAEQGGRIVKTTGDGFLVEFPSPTGAVECAIAIQDALRVEGTQDNGQALKLRIGINLGDIIIESDGDVFGDGVNIAARLEQIAEPGSILISSKVHEEVRGKLPYVFEDMGEQEVKNIDRPIRVFAIGRCSDGTTSAEVLRRALPLPDRPSIAVLPFTNMSGDPEQEYFADGITDDLLTALSRTRWLFVIARNSSFTFKGQAIDVKEVGRVLGVRYVLEGSIRRAGKRVRITGQLIEVATGAHIWADRFDREIEDIFDLQDEITRAVVSAIEPTLLTAEIARARAKPTESLAAYDLYLRALPDFHSYTEAGFRHAEALLRKAVERDPEFSAAWAALSDCLARMTVGGWIADWSYGSEQACEAAHRAIGADNANGTALSIAAFTLAGLVGHFDEAADLANNALRLHPNSAFVCTNCGWVFVHIGEYERALSLLDTARRMSPIDPRVHLINSGTTAAYLFSGRFEEAELWARRTLERMPSHPVSLRYHTAALVFLDRLDEARAVASKLLEVQPNTSITRSRRSHYRDKAMFERFLEALKLAGIPE